MKMSFDSGTRYGDVIVEGVDNIAGKLIAIEQPADDDDGADTVLIAASRVDALIAALQAVKSVLAEGAPQP